MARIHAPRQPASLLVARGTTKPAPMPRALTAIGAVGPVAHVALVVALSAIVDGYDPLRDSISELGARDAPYRRLMNLAGFMGLGVALLAFAAGYHLLLRRGRLAPLATGLLIVAGGSMVAVGFFPCDPGCVDVTPTGRLHSLTSTPQAIALPWVAAVSLELHRLAGETRRRNTAGRNTGRDPSARRRATSPRR